MIQNVLTIGVVLAAFIYLGRYLYIQVISSKNKCDGCAIYKMHKVKALEIERRD